MGAGGETGLEPLEPPADRIPIDFALLRRNNDNKKFQDQGE